MRSGTQALIFCLFPKSTVGVTGHQAGSPGFKDLLLSMRCVSLTTQTVLLSLEANKVTCKTVFHSPFFAHATHSAPLMPWMFCHPCLHLLAQFYLLSLTVLKGYLLQDFPCLTFPNSCLFPLWILEDFKITFIIFS